jgi:hypothetical protein
VTVLVGDLVERSTGGEPPVNPGAPVDAEPFTITWEKGALKRPAATQDFTAKREDLVNGCVANLRLAHIGTVPVRTSFGRRLPFVYA